MMTGYPSSRATFWALSSLSTGPSLPGRIGTPAFFIARRAGPCPEQPDHVRRGTDELDVAGLADLGEIRALGEEPVAGMDRVGAGDLRGAQDRRHAQIAVGAARGPDADVLVGKSDVQGVLVRLGVDRDGLDSELAARADDAQRDFPTVRDQDFLEHCRLRSLDGEQTLAILTGLPFST